MSGAATDDDRLLLERLRDLAVVDLDALLAGAAGELHQRLLAAFAADVEDALSQARRRRQELHDQVARGPDPLAVLGAAASVRGREGGPQAAERIARRLGARAEAHRTMARLDDLVARVLPRLVEADRRRPH